MADHANEHENSTPLGSDSSTDYKIYPELPGLGEDKYTYQVGWPREDKRFVATVREFPSLSWLEVCLCGPK